MTAKYPSARRRLPASSLTLSFLLALGATPAFAAEASAGTEDGSAVAGAAAGAGAAAEVFAVGLAGTARSQNESHPA